MTDEIGGGRPWPREPGPDPVPRRRAWPAPTGRPSSGTSSRRLQFALLGLLTLLLGYAVTHRPPAPAPRVNRTPAVSPGPTQPADPWLGGRTSTGPAGLRLLVAGANPRVVDAATGAATPPPGIRLVSGMGLDAFPIGGSKIAVVEYAWAAGSYLRLSGVDPQILGRHAAVSRGFDGELIIVDSPRGRTTVAGVGGDLRVRWKWYSPDTLTVLGDTPLGLVLQRAGRTADDRDLILVDRRSGAVRRVLAHHGTAVAVGARAAAWAPEDCTKPCPLTVGDLGTDDRRKYPMPAGWTPKSGAFSPDARSLALTFRAVTTCCEPGRVGVLDLRTGAVATVPDLRTAPDLGAHLAWSADGRWLVIGLPWPDRQAIALWRPGASLRVLPTVLPGHPGPLTVLP